MAPAYSCRRLVTELFTTVPVFIVTQATGRLLAKKKSGKGKGDEIPVPLVWESTLRKQTYGLFKRQDKIDWLIGCCTMDTMDSLCWVMKGQ